MKSVVCVALVCVVGVSALGELCQVGTTTGVCLAAATCSGRKGTAHTGVCSGGNVCCVYPFCLNGHGLCMPSDKCTGGTVVTGQCPGPSGFTCCDDIRCDNNKGTCLDTTLCGGMTVVTGKCPGPTGFACCEDLAPTRKYNRTRFYNGYIEKLGKLSESQRGGLDVVLTGAEKDASISDLRWLAYMLATVKHECANTYLPIEEYGKGEGRTYGKPVTVTDSLGNTCTNVYYGRGYVQLTWADNYRRMGDLVGEPRLLCTPSLALNARIAFEIMAIGMVRGSFTGVGLPKYISGHKCDYYNARRIINGISSAQLVADYAVKFQAILEASRL